MKDKTSLITMFNKLEEKYEIVDILTALGTGLTTAMLYLKGKEKDTEKED